MENNFVCPKCKGFLNVGGNVILATKTKNGKTGLILLHEQLGNYAVLKHPKYDFEIGEQVDFYCPMCHVKLKSDKHSNLAMVLMKGRTDQEYKVFFSEVAGERSTFVLVGDNMEIYGKDAKQYINFFNLAQNF